MLEIDANPRGQVLGLGWGSTGEYEENTPPRLPPPLSSAQHTELDVTHCTIRQSLP